MSSFATYLFAFLVGGILCVIAQILIDKTRLTPARILVMYVCVGVALTAIGAYQPALLYLLQALATQLQTELNQQLTKRGFWAY